MGQTACLIKNGGLNKTPGEVTFVKSVSDLGECMSEERVPQAEGNSETMKWKVAWGQNGCSRVNEGEQGAQWERTGEG